MPVEIEEIKKTYKCSYCDFVNPKIDVVNTHEATNCDYRASPRIQNILNDINLIQIQDKIFNFVCYQNVCDEECPFLHKSSQKCIHQYFTLSIIKE